MKTDITADHVRTAREKLGHRHNEAWLGAQTIADALNAAVNKGWTLDGTKVRYTDDNGSVVTLSVTTDRYDSDRDYRTKVAEKLFADLVFHGVKPAER